MKAIFYQDGFMYSFTFNASQDELSKIVGTACNRFFEFAMMCKKTGVKSCKFSQPIGLMISDEKDIPLFDSFDSEEFKTSLKLQRNPKGLAKFARRTLEVIEFANSTIIATDVNELEAAVK